MHKVNEEILFKLFKLGFMYGVKRSTILPDKILREELKDWMKVNLSHEEPSKGYNERMKVYNEQLSEPYH